MPIIMRTAVLLPPLVLSSLLLKLPAYRQNCSDKPEQAQTRVYAILAAKEDHQNIRNPSSIQNNLGTGFA
jgi:hypothetical protein